MKRICFSLVLFYVLTIAGSGLLSDSQKLLNDQLNKAAGGGDNEKIKLLIAQGAQCTAKDAIFQSTPLHSASYRGHLATVKLLVEEDKSLINEKDSDGQTPFFAAAKNGQRDIVAFLLDKGAFVDEKNIFDETPLFVACENGHLETAQLLLEKGAALNAQSKEKITPLHSACKNGHKEVVNLLLEQGAIFNTKDLWGYSPLEAAQKNQHSAIVKLLQEYRLKQAHN